MRLTLIPFALGVAAVAGCSPYGPELSQAPFFCGPTEPRCPGGFTCVQDGSDGDEVCLAPNGTIPVDGNVSCADDSAYESNNTLPTAWMTAVGPTRTVALDGLAICPAGDKDNFAVMIATAGENLELLVQLDLGGAALGGAILNAGGVPIAPLSAVTGVPGTLRAYAPSLSAGAYYAQVDAPDGGSNNYTLTVNVTGP